MARTINQAGLDLVKHFEGFYAQTYLCPAGVLTIGYGHTGRDVVLGQCIDQREAEALLREDMEAACAAVQRLVTVELNDNQFAALASFCFNCGSGNLGVSTLLKKLNHEDYDAVPGELARWSKATDPATGVKRTLPGLVRRRAAEAELWLLSSESESVEEGAVPSMPQRLEPPADSVRYEVIARSGLKLRGGPGQEYETLEVLAPQQLVATGRQRGEWVEVDKNSDGLVDGWVFADYLRRLG